MRFSSVRDYENYLKRLDAMPATLDAVIARMQTAMAAGWMPPRIAIERVPRQLEAQLDPDLARHPQHAPFRQWPDGVPQAERDRLAAAGERAIRDSLIPAFHRLREFYAQSYLPAARTDLGASALPGGPAYYDALLARNTTTTMGAREIHELGLREGERIGSAMRDAIAASSFKGTRVDTGLHAFGWSRDRAIAYLEEHAALTHGFAVAEVDRYLVWPAQATAYKVGELRIKRTAGARPHARDGGMGA